MIASSMRRDRVGIERRRARVGVAAAALEALRRPDQPADLVVSVEALPDLRPSVPAATRRSWIGDGRKRSASLEALVQGSCDGQIDVDPDQVDEREGTHRVAAGDHRGVDGRDVGLTASSIRRASSVNGRLTRLTMKPGASRQAMGSLPSASMNAIAASIVGPCVRSPATTSTRGMSGAGLKKWRPITRPGRVVASAMAVTESAEVFVASNASGGAARSSAAKMACLAARSSTAASMTTSAPWATSAQIGHRRQPRAGSLVGHGLELALGHHAAQPGLEARAAGIAASGETS